MGSASSGCETPPAPTSGSRPGPLADVNWCGHRFGLRCDRTAWWPAADTLIVADPHFGKAATFRDAGVPVPAGTTADNLTRLGAALDDTGAGRLLILGDLFHARRGVSEEMLAEMAVWRDARPGVEMLNVRGNHDRHAGDPPAAVGIGCVAGPWSDPAFSALRFAHDPAELKDLAQGEGGLAGHLHPAVVLEGAGRSRMRAACFHFGPSVAVLPAFGAFTGMHPVRVRAGDRVFAVGPGAVVEVS